MDVKMEVLVDDVERERKKAGFIEVHVCCGGYRLIVFEF